MDNEATIYGTPSPETPFSTPISSPRRVSYRANPVKMIRQHVPLKIQSCVDAKDPSPEQDSSNANPGINPMKTKRIKCVIQPSFLYQDGVGDQLLTPRNTGDNQPIENNKGLRDSSSKQNIPVPDKNSDLIASTPQNTDVGGQRALCHSRGDAETVNTITYSPMKSDSCKMEVTQQSSQFNCTIVKHPNEPRELQIPEIMESVAAVEKEIESIDQFVQDSLQRFHKVEEAVTGENSDQKAAKHANKATGKLRKDDNKEKHNAPCKKLSCVHDVRSNLPAGHECEKKKFYDPQDIRKYMLKKKNERREKEREEKCRKAKEQAALKRKAEVTKLFSNRAKLPSHKNLEHQVTEVSDKSKKIKTAKLDRGTQSAEGLVAKTKRVDDPTAIVQSRNVQATRDDGFARTATRTRSPQSRKFKYDEPDDGSKMPTGGDKVAADHFGETETLKADASACLPSELDFLNFKSPYNFLDVLKSKINLARNVDSYPTDVNTDSFVTPEARKKDNTMGEKKDIIEDLLRKRQKMTNMVKLHSGPEAQTPLTLQPELTLSDLNMSPEKGNETFRVWNTKKSDRTFTISSDQEPRRKSAKMYNKNVHLKENRDGLLEMSGVKPLASSKPLASTPLAEKNTIADPEATRICGRRDATIPIASEKQGGLPERKYTSESFDSEKVADSNVGLARSSSNLMKTFSLESLKASNVSFSLPDPWKYVVRDGTSQNNPSLQNYSSLFHTDYTLTSMDSDKVPVTNDNVGGRAPLASDDLVNISASNVLVDLYDQMIRSEDEKLSQILSKIQLQKEALDKYLRSEVFALESHKNEFREAKAEDKIKTIKKKQRAILLKVTKNILELDKMKKSVVDTVERRKSELLKQKIALQERRALPRQKLAAKKPKQTSEGGNRTVIISNQMNTFLGISSSSLTSIIVEDDHIKDTNQPCFRNELRAANSELTANICGNDSVVSKELSNVERKDRATSPVQFNAGISIRLDLDPEKLLQLKNSYAQIKIQSNVNARDSTTLTLDQLENPRIENSHLSLSAKDDSISEENDETDAHRSKAIKIKRPLSPVILPPSKKVLHLRRQSSSSEFTLASLNDTTTDQSDVELRISALQEQLRQRKLEAERLRNEEKKLRKEKLRTKEQSLIKQLEAYDQYIKRLSQMLADESGFLEISKPQIKDSSTRRQFIDSLHGRKSTEPLAVETAESGTSANHDLKSADDAETNTEDSEKQLKKADSGILIESEVTEPSENVDLHLKSVSQHSELDKAESAEDHVNSSAESVIHTEVSSPQDKDTKSSVCEDPPSKAPQSEHFLQLVNDLQSEVLSLSEQLYSSDFVEDIPEDIEDIPEDVADSMSEVSENVTSNSNAPMSIDEGHSIGEQTKQTESELKSIEKESAAESVELEKCEADQSGENSLHAVHVQPSVSDSEKSSQTGMATSVHEEIADVDSKIDSSEQIITEVNNDQRQATDFEISQPSKVDFDVSEADLTPENDSINSTNVNQRVSNSSDGELNFLNVRNISDIDSLLLEDTPNEEQLSEGEVPASQSIGNAKPSDDSIVEDIKSASSLERLSDDSEQQTPKFVASDENESRTSHELLKLNYLNESEDSDVTDVQKPALLADEVETMVNEVRSSSSEADDSLHVDFEPRFDIVLNVKPRLQSPHADVSIALPSEDVQVTSDSCRKVEADRAEEKRPAESTPRRNEHFVTEYGMEETDVSESLEYDAVPVDSVDELHPSSDHSKDQVTDLDDDNAKSPVALVNGTSEGALPDSVAGRSDEARKSRSEETSREADRSVEEFVEDFSIPNVFDATLNEGDNGSEEADHDAEPAEVSASSREESTPEEVLSVNADSNDDDLDTKITEDQTPFLQALRRERDSLIAQKQESADKITVDLFDTLIEETYADLVSTMSQKMSDCESGNTRAGEPEAKAQEKLDEPISTDQNAEKFEKEWYDKLKFDESRLREAEELRLQQMKIEQEIEELQAQQHIPPYIYLREIPNKPPPPYTPPSSQSTRIPGNEHELKNFIKSTIDYVCDELEKGNSVEDVKLLPDYAKVNKLNRDVATYKRFLFDLTKEMAREVLQDMNRAECLPWEALSKNKIVRPKPKGEELRKAIDEKISVLFGFKSKINKEKLIIQWSRKKKTDFVDDLLIQELQEEEGEWTNYEKDELIIKNQIAQRLLNELIEDTVVSLQDAFQKKEQSRE